MSEKEQKNVNYPTSGQSSGDNVNYTNPDSCPYHDTWYFESLRPDNKSTEKDPLKKP